MGHKLPTTAVLLTNVHDTVKDRLKRKIKELEAKAAKLRDEAETIDMAITELESAVECITNAEDYLKEEVI